MPNVRARAAFTVLVFALPCCSAGATMSRQPLEAGTPRDAAALRDAGRPTDDGAVTGDAPASADARDEDDARAEATTPTCSDGSPVAYLRTSCPGAPPKTPPALATALADAARGEVVSLSGLDASAAPCLPVSVCVPASAPTLLFSDEPEAPTSDGILYADVLPSGRYRAYVYHVNAGAGLRKFDVVLLNEGTTTVHATVGPKGIAGPSDDYVSVGKQAVLAWMTATTTATVDVPAGERVLLDADLDAVHASNGQLSHGILDFVVDGTLKASVVTVDADEDAALKTASLPLLANTGEHLRGTFAGAELVLETTPGAGASGVTRLDLGGGVTDVPLSGHDYVDGTAVTLVGDYGVPYTLLLHLAGDAALLVAPEGGAWGGVAAIPAGLDGVSSTTLLPAASDSLGSQAEAIFAGRYAGGGVTRARLMTAGGSNLPIDVAVARVP